MPTEDDIRRLVRDNYVRASGPPNDSYAPVTKPMGDSYRALTPEEKAMLDARRRRRLKEEDRMYAPLPPKR